MPQYIGSSTPLTGTSVYTSPWVNTDTWASVGGSAFADQAGTLYVEQSGDAIHADLSTSHAVAASTGTKYTEDLLLPYVRLRYVNGNADQTVLRLFSRFVLGNGT